jgi:DNA-binding protein YbaB
MTDYSSNYAQNNDSNSLNSVANQAKLSSEAFRKKLADANNMLIQKSKELHEKLKQMTLEAESDDGFVTIKMTPDGTNIETIIDKAGLKNSNLFGLQNAISLAMTRLLEKNRKLSEEQAKLLSKSLMEDFSKVRQLEKTEETVN